MAAAAATCRLLRLSLGGGCGVCLSHGGGCGVSRVRRVWSGRSGARARGGGRRRRYDGRLTRGGPYGAGTVALLRRWRFRMAGGGACPHWGVVVTWSLQSTRHRCCDWSRIQRRSGSCSVVFRGECVAAQDH